jgi:anaerobic selenocysteine-containing dehydrogenase
MSVTLHRSVCPYDCPDACGLLVAVEESRAVKVSGDPDHPYTRGTLCPKMNRYPDTVHSPLRLTEPLERCGPKGDAQFRPISWAAAIDTIAAQWRHIIATTGAEAILPYSYAGTMGLVQRNAGHPFFHRLGASLLDRTICAPAMGLGWDAVMGKTPALWPEAVRNCDLIILWGINAAATNVHFLKDVRAAVRRGAKVWLIETYRTPTANIAQRTFIVRPGSDGALALGLMHLLERNGSCHHDFLRDHVQGFDALSARVLPDYPPEKVSRITGLSGDQLEEMATALAEARRLFVKIGSGLSRYGNGAMTVRTIVALPALVGAYAQPGCGCFTGTATGEAFNLDLLLDRNLISGRPRTINMNQLGSALNTLGSPPVESLYVYHANPAAVAPDQNQVLRGLAREDLFTVVHERFMTDTAAFADIVLPAASSLETSDIYRSYGTYCIQRTRPVIPPVGLSKSNWEVFALLAEAMGFDDPVFKKSAEEIIAQILDVPRPMRDGIDLQAFDEGRAVQLKNGFKSGAFATPSGKIEILNPRLAQPLPAYLPPYGGDGPLCLMTAPTLYALNSSFYERADLRRKQQSMQLMMHPADAGERALEDGQRVIAFNALGEVVFFLRCTEKVPPGVVVAEGVWWLAFAPGRRSVNALTSQRLTDRGNGSTFYDNRVDVRPAESRWPAGRSGG